MSTWGEVLGDAPAERPAKQRAVVGNEAMYQELIVIGVKLGLRNAKDISTVCASAYRAYRAETKDPVVQAIMRAASLHNDKYRGQSGHDGGAPDPWAFAAMAMALKPNMSEEHAKCVDTLLARLPPTEKLIRAFVPCVRVEKCHSSAKKKLYFKLQRVPGLVTEEQKNEIEDICSLALVKAGFEPLHGMAPRGSLERKAQEILERLGKAGSSKEAD